MTSQGQQKTYQQIVFCKAWFETSLELLNHMKYVDWRGDMYKIAVTRGTGYQQTINSRTESPKGNHQCNQEGNGRNYRQTATREEYSTLREIYGWMDAVLDGVPTTKIATSTVVMWSSW